MRTGFVDGVAAGSLRGTVEDLYFPSRIVNAMGGVCQSRKIPTEASGYGLTPSGWIRCGLYAAEGDLLQIPAQMISRCMQHKSWAEEPPVTPISSGS